ncbi:uncharacterized protein LOC124703126 [Lolium rigidum]|uniref:uncharacterized protein LOC124703126 n=1 Tax=Lolium rigidum TaxID=89674 RepID=UPI001F5D4B9A|nr:uncharacterized protein LOC124703126 [Lolium rigidum]
MMLHSNIFIDSSVDGTAVLWPQLTVIAKTPSTSAALFFTVEAPMAPPSRDSLEKVGTAPASSHPCSKTPIQSWRVLVRQRDRAMLDAAVDDVRRLYARLRAE